MESSTSYTLLRLDSGGSSPSIWPCLRTCLKARAAKPIKFYMGSRPRHLLVLAHLTLAFAHRSADSGAQRGKKKPSDFSSCPALSLSLLPPQLAAAHRRRPDAGRPRETASQAQASSREAVSLREASQSLPPSLLSPLDYCVGSGPAPISSSAAREANSAKVRVRVRVRSRLQFISNFLGVQFS